MKKLRTFAVSMIIAAIGLLIYCAGFYIKSYEQNLAARQEYAELSKMAGVKNRAGAGLLADGKKTDEDSSTKNSEKKRRKKQRRSSESKNKNCTDEIRESFGISWENLRKINSQTVAWITVPGADISYPVVQAADDEYYLKHNFRGEEDLFGCIFLEHDIKKNFTDSHSILPEPSGYGFPKNKKGNDCRGNDFKIIEQRSVCRRGPPRPPASSPPLCRPKTATCVRFTRMLQTLKVSR